MFFLMRSGLGLLTFLFLCNSPRAQDVIDCSLDDLDGVTLTDIINSLNDTELDLVEEIQCDSSGFTGSFPPEIGLLTNLKVISVANNLFEGDLPEELSTLSSLESLDVSHNCLTGEVLLLLEELDIVSLDLDLNKFSGGLNILTEFLSLQQFSARRNDFSGSVPNLENQDLLEIFIADDNRLDGSVPDGFSGLGNLDTLKLSDNYLEGSMPDHNASNTDVAPDSSLDSASITQRWKTFTLPKRCPNRFSFALDKMFDESIKITAPLLAVLALLVCSCCGFSVYKLVQRRRGNLFNRRRSDMSSMFDPKKHKILVYISQPSSRSEEVEEKTRALRAQLKEAGMKTTMYKEKSADDTDAFIPAKIDEMAILDSAAILVCLTKSYLSEMTKDGSICSMEIQTALESGVNVIMVCLEKNVYVIANSMGLMDADYTLLDFNDEKTSKDNFDELFEILVASQAEKEAAELQLKVHTGQL